MDDDKNKRVLFGMGSARLTENVWTMEQSKLDTVKCLNKREARKGRVVGDKLPSNARAERTLAPGFSRHRTLLYAPESHKRH